MNITTLLSARMHRLKLLPMTALAAVSLAFQSPASGQAPAGDASKPPASAPFSFDLLKASARSLAAQPYRAPSNALPEPIAHLTWDQMQAIRFKDDHALWRKDDAPFRVRFFHLGLFNKTPVRMFEVVNGNARPLEYQPELFEYDGSGVDAERLPASLGFAGFQLVFRSDWKHDFAAFQGASYFRAVGGSGQFGMSARGLAIDCGLSTPEEFPIFTAFWFERPASGATAMNLYALLDSPSTSGAYRFKITPGEPLTMDIDAALYPRRPIAHLGIAPLTSMFLCAENDRRVSEDFRPEIHDTDGLAVWTGAGEWIWRPLVNPRAVRLNFFVDHDVRGFGLLQRDRNFDHYQDDGVFYERRPSVWVEPQPDAAGKLWGPGSVELVEIPTPDETNDNIGAFWHPDKPPRAGDQLSFAYRLYWGAEPPVTPPLATVRATRTGIGGVVGQPRKHYSRRFVVDFAGGELGRLGREASVEPVITSSRGAIELPSARPLVEINGWRAIFDIKPTDASTEPINLRLYLRCGSRPLTETWLYQWNPPPPSERTF